MNRGRTRSSELLGSVAVPHGETARRKSNNHTRSSGTAIPIISLLFILLWSVTFVLFHRILPSDLTDTEATSFELTVTAGGLNVRGGPNVRYAKMSSLQQGMRASVLDHDLETGWLLVLLEDGRSGWVSGSKAFASVSPAGTERQLPRPNGYSRFLLGYGPALALSFVATCLVSTVVFLVLRRRFAALGSAVLLAVALSFFGGVSDYFVGYRADRYLSDTTDNLQVMEVHSARELYRRWAMIEQTQELRRHILHPPIELFIEREAWPLTVFTVPLFGDPVDPRALEALAAAAGRAVAEN